MGKASGPVRAQLPNFSLTYETAKRSVSGRREQMAADSEGERKMAREMVIATASDWSDGSMAPVEVGEHRVALCDVFNGNHFGLTVFRKLSGASAACGPEETAIHIPFTIRGTDGEKIRHRSQNLGTGGRTIVSQY